MPARRTSTRKTTRKKYTVDAFEGIEELQSGPGSDKDETPDAPREDPDEDDEFDTGSDSPDPEEGEPSGVEPHVSGDNGVDGFASDVEDVDLDDDVSGADEDALDDEEDTDPTGRSRVKQIRRNADGEVLYTRGVDDSTLTRSGRYRKQTFYGPAREDRESVLRACNRWSNAAALPTRKPQYGHLGGFEYTIAYQAALKNANVNWRWYSSDGGQGFFSQRQVLRELSAEHAKVFWCIEGTGNRSFIAGPIKEQRLVHLAPGQSFPLAEPFETDGITHGENYKPGFLLNLGARIQSLDWVPNRHDEHQYLAVSTLMERDDTRPRIDRPRAPAFTPGLPHQSNIQIWRFVANSNGYIDRSSAPQLVAMFCMSVGDIKALKWCPVPLEEPAKLGLLAFISADGAIRVLDVDTPPRGSGTCYQSVEAFAFVSKPPDTVCTCLTWLSSTRVAAGCANGMVPIWDIPRCLRSKTDRPAIYAPISVTYIQGITSCWPSCPEFLAATSMAGRLTLTDITKPRPGSPENTVTSVRTRIGQQALLWNDHTQSTLSVDDSYVLRSNLYRRFFTTLGVARFRAITLCMATSPCHPFVLSGGANGEVLGCNPISRIASGSKSPQWQQIWFRHEWRQPTDEDQSLAEGDAQNQARATVAQDGLTRFLDGFKIETVNLNIDGKTGPNTKDGIPYATIYEERTAVTALAWNPNIHVGGWAAAGMGDGLLRVEDLAY